MVISFCICACLLVLAVVRASRAYGGWSLVSPLGLFASFFSFVYFFVPGMQEALKINQLDHDFYGKDAPATVATLVLPLLYFLVCVSVFRLHRPAMARPAELRRAALSKAPAEGRLVLLLLLIELVSLGGTLYVIRGLSAVSYAALLAGRSESLRGVGYFIDPVIVGYTAALILALPAFAGARMPRGARGALIFLAVVAAAIPNAFLARRLIALMGFAYLLLAYLAARAGKFPVVKAMAALLLILSVIAGMGVIRTQLFEAGFVSTEEARQDIASGRFLVDEMTGSFGQLEWLGYLREHRNRWQFLYGSTYFSVIAAPIPRGLWADKPARAGPLVHDTVFQSSPGTGGLTTGCVMEPYVNGGILGLIVAAALHGWMLAAVTKYGARARYRHQVVIYLLLAACLGEMIIYGEFYGVAIRIAILVLPVVLYTKAISRLERGRARSRGRDKQVRSAAAVLAAAITNERIVRDER